MKLQKTLSLLQNDDEFQMCMNCPRFCPGACSPTNASACPQNCPFDSCVECSNHFDAVSKYENAVNAIDALKSKMFTLLNQGSDSLYSSASEGTCVDSIAKCYNLSTLRNSSVLIDSVRSEAQNCASINLKYCPLLGCVDPAVACIPLSSCPASRPQRCPFVAFKDGSSPCVFRNATCPNTDVDIIQASCPPSEQLCPGGLQCASGTGAQFFRVCFARIFFCLSMAVPVFSTCAGLHV
jgi:hypothetical protein